MAEIPVERKSSMTWLWILLALILLGLIIWWATSGDDEENLMADEDIVAADTLGDEQADGTEGLGTEGGVTIAQILANPSQYIGTSDFQGQFNVAEVPTDRGFWVEQNGDRLFALIIDQPAEEPKDINPGQQIRVTDGMIRDTTGLSEMPGEPLDEATQQIASDQDALLLVDEANIEITSQG